MFTRIIIGGQVVQRGRKRIDITSWLGFPLILLRRSIARRPIDTCLRNTTLSRLGYPRTRCAKINQIDGSIVTSQYVGRLNILVDDRWYLGRKIF